MNIVLFCHPRFMKSQSMPRFANMLQTAYENLGHTVTVWAPQPKFFKWLPDGRLSKWAGYVDQYIVFPAWARRALRYVPADALFVFCDQALGPWVSLVQNRPHVVHAHDLLALRSALGDIPENPTSLSGRIYQRYIRRGFRRATHFIAASSKTREDLEAFGGVGAHRTVVIYNGLNYAYSPMAPAHAAEVLAKAGMHLRENGVLLHVGGQQWYKNLPGVIALYAEYARREAAPLELWCVSPPANARTRQQLDQVPANGKVSFFRNLDPMTLQAAYSSARAFLFPSLAEGFGWPLIEAQACGCPVITTDAAPMNEVAGDAAVYVPLLLSTDDMGGWARIGADVLQTLLTEDPQQRSERAARGRQWAARFNMQATIDKYLSVYERVLQSPVVGAAA